MTTAVDIQTFLAKLRGDDVRAERDRYREALEEIQAHDPYNLPFWDWTAVTDIARAALATSSPPREARGKGGGMSDASELRAVYLTREELEIALGAFQPTADYTLSFEALRSLLAKLRAAQAAA